MWRWSSPANAISATDGCEINGLLQILIAIAAATQGDIFRYQEVELMTDILIRDIPDEVIAAIDARAKRVGLSRTEYLRRTLERERAGVSGPITLEHLEKVATLTVDLDDRDVMSNAWT